MTEQLIQTPFGEFCAPEHDLIASHLARHGAHNISDLEIFLRMIRSGDTVVDIGAHIGTYAIAAARAAGPAGSVVAFECYEPTFELLCRNIERNRALVRAVYGVVDDAERAYAIETAHGNTGATRLNGVSDGAAGIPVITDIRRHVANRIDVLKIDVEGMEPNVLSALTDVLKSDRPVIMIEISRAELAARGRSCEEIGALLKSLGYRLFLNRSDRTVKHETSALIEIPGLWVCGPQADILCVHCESDRLPQAVAHRLGASLSLVANFQYARARLVALAKRYLPRRVYAALKNAVH